MSDPDARRAAALLPLFRLASPALPIGAFACSQGLEPAVELGWVSDEVSARAWIAERLEHALARSDLPLLLRMHAAWSAGDPSGSVSHALRWSARLLASRESGELQREDRRLGSALARLLAALGDAQAERLALAPECTLAAAFALAGARSGSAALDSATAYAWGWLEGQVAAAQRILPLGQTAAQRILLAGAERVPAALVIARDLPDDELGAASPGLALASALHEDQYTRLFRS